jgi:hypothetical protein
MQLVVRRIASVGKGHYYICSGARFHPPTLPVILPCDKHLMEKVSQLNFMILQLLPLPCILPFGPRKRKRKKKRKRKAYHC